MGALMRAHDWAASRLGEPASWPQPLKTAVRLILNTGHPMYIWWGPDLLCFYNDAYRASIGIERHPGSLGRPGQEVWDEIWPIIGPQIEFVMTGQGATWNENHLVPITRDGHREEVYWTYSYGPIDDEGAANGVGGVLVVCTETTRQVLAEKQRTSEVERLRQLFEQAPGAVAVLRGPRHVFEIVNPSYADLIGGREVIGQTVAEALPEVVGQGFVDLLDWVYQNAKPHVGRAVAIDLVSSADDAARRRLLDFVYQPIMEGGVVTGIFVQATDVTERANAEAELRESEGRLRFLRTLDESLAQSRDAAVAMATAARLLGRELEVSRCAYADVDDNGNQFTIRDDYTALGIASSTGTYSLDLFGARAAADMRQERTLIIRDVSEELVAGNGRDMFQSIDIQAIVCCPLVREDKLVAMMAVHQSQPRSWRDDEIRTVEATVERCWAYVERVAAETRLRESEERLRLATEAAEVGLWDVDVLNNLLIWPPRVKAMFGISADVPVCMADFYSGLHPEDREATSNAFAAACDPVLRSLYDVEYRTVGSEDAVLRWVAAKGRGVFDESGKCVRVIGTAIDVTNRKQIEAALVDFNHELEMRVADRTRKLLESQRRFQGIFDSAFQFMALLTPSGTVVEVNETALKWSGIEPEDIVGKEFWLTAPMRENPTLQTAIKAGIRRAAGGEIVREEHEMRGSGEVRAHVDFSLKPVLGENDEAMWLIAEGRDITELKLAQEALRQSQKLEAIGQLTGGVAHDFNNLLTIIRSSSDLLRKPGIPEERRRRYVDAISETVDRAAKLTGQLLSFARRQALAPEIFDPIARIRSITDMLRTLGGSRIEIVTEFLCDRCFVEADAGQFETALVNMAANARDAMDGEGRLAIRVAEKVALPSIRGHAGSPGRYVAISMSDTGCGIPSDQLGAIFEPFFTTKDIGKGTGLGLSQVFGFAKQSGGDVAVRSEVGHGTTFTLYLPRATKAGTMASVTDDHSTLSSETGHGRRVLVVEDNLDVGAFSTQLLADLGYETTWAKNANEALTILESVDNFDVVFSDVVMPGMGGVELGLEIRRRYPTLPVVLTSGYSHVLAQEGRFGFELLRKPYAAEELSSILRRVLRLSLS
jgi:PAS domain S-box-containing protein